ncbi:IS1634 family transposase [Sporolactobacillus vineae]|uniref:IS1634 family transposase n=1 Tax=Sporolactobacillus vineae TaxID=444463 RepID=UPI000288A71D|nr:IS1634 family transposase [Sporolactobacillus vineae]
MYLRRVSRKNKDGSTVAYLQLAHNEWNSEAKYAKARVIYSFGREDQLDVNALRRLVESISRYLSPEEALRAQASIGQIADFTFKSAKRLGGVWTLDQLWKQLGLDQIIQTLLVGRKHDNNVERLIFTMVANRAVDPTSKLGLQEWIRKEVALPGLNEAHVHQFYRAMDLLLGMRSQLEEQVYFATADLLNLEVDLIYFDTTSSYFEVEPQEAPDGEQLRKLGYSKDKRPDLLQVVIGMAVTKEGLPIRCWVWPGNTADKTVVEEAKKDLVGWKLGRVINVMDRGFSTEDNLTTLQRAGGHYIVGEPMRSGKKIVDEAMARKGRYQKIRDNLEVKEIVVGDGEKRQRFVMAYNPKEAEKEKKQRERLVQDLESALEDLHQLPEKKHTKAACALRSHKLYGRYLRQLKDGQLRINRQALHDAERYDGKYLIRTSDDTLSAEEIALGYKNLIAVENGFRTLKSTLSLRPMYHRIEDRIKTHVLINWLALLLIRLAELKTGDTWPTLRRTMDQLVLGKFSSQNGDFYQRTELTAEQSQILKILGVEAPQKIIRIDLKA